MNEQLSIISVGARTLAEWAETTQVSADSCDDAVGLTLPECDQFVFWQRLFDSPAVASFDERLACDGLTEQQAREIVVRSESAGDCTTTTAGQNLADELQVIKAAQRLANASSQTPGRDLMPRDLAEPFVAVARTRLSKTLSSGPAARLARAHESSLAQPLMRDLVELIAPVTEENFDHFRNCSLAIQDLVGADPEDEQTLRTRWSTTEPRLRLAEICNDYPVAARLAARLVLDWVKNTSLLLARLCRDWPDLIRNDRLLAPCPSSTPADCPSLVIELGLSDRHHGGQTVCRVTAAGRTIYYKPRPMGLERAYNNFLAWLTLHAAPYSLPSLHILNRGPYGWAESAVREPLANERLVADFYRLAGALLLVLDVVGGVDAHGENIVATADGPVLIDAEATMHLRRAPTRPTDAVTDHLAHSVLSVGLLPRCQLDADAVIAQAGAGFYTSHDVAAARNPNELPDNAPVYAAKAQPADSYVAEICDGYESMHRFVQRHRVDIVNSPEWLAFRGHENRHIFRATSIYAHALDLANEPRLLRNGVERSLSFEVLTPAFTTDPLWRDRWWMARDELASLARGDVPRFTGTTDAAWLNGAAPHAPGGFDRSGFDLAEERIARLDDVDLAFQTSLIQQVLTPPPNPEIDVSSGSSAPVTHINFEMVRASEAAELLVHRLLARSLTAYDGTISWLGGRHDALLDQTSFYSLGPELYSGLAGIACALAAYGTSAHKPQARSHAVQIVENLRRQAEKFDALSDEALAKAMPFGLGHGATGIAVALSSIDDLVDAPASQVASRYAALAGRLWDAELAPNKTDLLQGPAGALISLAEIAHKTSDDALASVVALIAESELRALERGADCYTTDPTSLRELTLGHGSIGRVVALARYGQQTADSRYLDPVPSALDAAVHAVNESLRSNAWASSPGGLSWCNGLVGAGFALLELAQFVPSITAAANTLRTLCRAVASTPIEHGTDVICCGHWGAVDLLIEASNLLDDALLLDSARMYAHRLLDHDLIGPVNRAPSATSAPNPGLFQGEAGIIMTLLRLSDPYAASSPLRFFS